MNRRLIQPLAALASGLLFGAGLALSGMMNPAKVYGFLDVTGRWDPTLAFVMAGAVAVMALAWLVQKRMAGPIAETRFAIPDRTVIDGKLVLGAAMFGGGWGLAGLCPGPGLASLATEPVQSAMFVLPMLGGMVLYGLMTGRGAGKGGR